MITFKKLKWSNAFSYGEDNEIDFSSEPLIQLVGKNGSGKTSISMILQEVLFGKNISNIKKQDISNRFTTDKGYSISLEFEKEGINYLIDLNRKTSIKLKLFENGKDISSHTSINTYKNISNILGIQDFKTFTQLIYQSSTNSLDFLTATDTNRKKFLISLLNLDNYIQFHDKFKEDLKDINIEISRVQGSIEVINGWLKEHENEDLTPKEPKNAIKLPENKRKELIGLKNKLTNIKDINRKITTNNHYKEQLKAIDSTSFSRNIPDVSKELSQLKTKISVLYGELTHPISMINKLKELGFSCPTCYQDIKLEHKEKLIIDYISQKDSIYNELEDYNIQVKKLEADNLKFLTQQASIRKFEQLINLIDKELDSITIDKQEIENKILTLSKEIEEFESEQRDIERYNLKVSSHNSRIKVIQDQKVKFNNDLISAETDLLDLQDLQSILEILKKAFSTNGLVSYKIESSIKELEEAINLYLSEFGFFRIYFKLSGDKLNIEVNDDMGNTTTMDSLSAGEKARVNIATVLAIRKMMTALTDTHVNLLFLDEIVGVIDEEGKEKLMEVLLKENLNTFMVSHGYEHPLIPKIEVIKENNISRIEQ